MKENEFIKIGDMVIEWKNSDNYIDELTSSRYMNLSSIGRYSNKKLIIPESTAEHTIQCELIAIWIYDRLVELGVTLDKKDLIYRCFIHDLDESVMCDIPRDIKYHDEDMLHKVNDIADELLRKSGLTEDMVTEIQLAKHNCLEGDLVGYIDTLQAFIKIEQEYRLQGSMQILKMMAESIGYLQDKIDTFESENATVITFLIGITNDAIHRFNKATGLSIQDYHGDKMKYVLEYQKSIEGGN
jgi:5'-deoxynucleotidase YfbR-like HD superfamily hydrolase